MAFSTLIACSLVLAIATFITASPLEKRDFSYAPSGPEVNNWSTLGCANDLYPNARALNAGYYENQSGQTIANCLSYCASQGTYLAGIEYGYQCFCGPSLDNGASITQAAPLSATSNGGCTTACSGNNAQNCGGPNHLLVFQNKNHGRPTIATLANQAYSGCYADNVNSRLLPFTAQGSDPTNTPSKCASACNGRGYDLSGTEYRNQCFCGSSTSVNLGTKLSETRCESSCSGDVNLICGGASALTVYKSGNAVPSDPATYTFPDGTKYNLQGCYNDRPDSQGRALSTYNSFSDNSVAKCLSTCKAYVYAGLEYGSECRCGNTLATFSKSGATCNKPCSGNSQQICGGDNYAMTLYKKA